MLAGLEIGGKSGRGFAVGLGERRIAVDVLVESLADDRARPAGSRGPSTARRPRCPARSDRATASACRRARSMVSNGFLPAWDEANETWPDGMPVLRHHDIGKALGDAVDHRNDLLAVLHGEAAARQEAVLDIDHQQRRCVVGLDRAAAQSCFEHDRRQGHRAQAGKNLPSVQHAASPHLDWASKSGRRSSVKSISRRPGSEPSICGRMRARKLSAAEFRRARRGSAETLSPIGRAGRCR